MAWGAAPEAERPVLGARASTSGAPGTQDGAVSLLRDLLAAFFQAYTEDASEVRKPQMALLLAQAHQCGLVGAAVLPALASLHDSLRPELETSPEKFAAFYHFIFFVARDEGQRNLRQATALQAWGFVLGNGRFQLLGEWLAFVERKQLARGVSEDTWCQVLDFANALTNHGGARTAIDAYDPRGAWPVLVDEFVDFLKPHDPTRDASSRSPQEDAWRVRGWGDWDRDVGFWNGRPVASSGASESLPARADGAARPSERRESASPYPPAVYNGGSAGGSGLGFGACDVLGNATGGGSLAGVGVYESDASSWILSKSSSDRGDSGGTVARAASAVPALVVAEHRLHRPTAQIAVGCKRRLSAVLEMDGLANQLERQARVESPGFGHSANRRTRRDASRDARAGEGDNDAALPIQGSPARKYARRVERFD